MSAVWYRVLLFAAGSAGLYRISRASLKDPSSHGFYRFFAWECILALFCLNLESWFSEAFGARQLLSWTLLSISLALVYLGVCEFRKKGNVDGGRNEAGLLGIEKTTALVTSGIYQAIRHPFYSSLLFLGWGIFLKQVSWTGAILAVVMILLLVATARAEEVENIKYFGGQYREYMRRTKRFIPYIF
ncbi:MAG TPA: isoprenylcysteine carboxylmethyltransferase family protein [Anaerolineales bacterium]|jgi:protein-S-isoprenylcysteine O-methyltransferase Ste14